MANKTCYMCKKFYMFMPQLNFSEDTPGYSWSMSCAEEVWHFDTETDNQNKFADCLETATKCKLFKYADYVTKPHLNGLLDNE